MCIEGICRERTPLIRAVLSTHVYDAQCLPWLLELVHPSIRTIDTANRSILHHATLSAGVRGRAAFARYYLEGTLTWVAEQEGADFRSLVDLQMNMATLRLISQPEWVIEVWCAHCWMLVRTEYYPTSWDLGPATLAWRQRSVLLLRPRFVDRWSLLGPGVSCCPESRGPPFDTTIRPVGPVSEKSRCHRRYIFIFSGVQQRKTDNVSLDITSMIQKLNSDLRL